MSEIQKQIESLRKVVPPPAKSLTAELIDRHRLLAQDRLEQQAKRAPNPAHRTSYTARVKDTDPEKGTVILELPNGGQFQARSLSPTALLPGQVVPIATLPRGQQIGVVDAPPVCR